MTALRHTGKPKKQVERECPELIQPKLACLASFSTLFSLFSSQGYSRSEGILSLRELLFEYLWN